jgi:hypothetical protein
MPSRSKQPPLMTSSNSCTAPAVVRRYRRASKSYQAVEARAYPRMWLIHDRVVVYKTVDCWTVDDKDTVQRGDRPQTMPTTSHCPLISECRL